MPFSSSMNSDFCSRTSLVFDKTAGRANFKIALAASISITSISVLGRPLASRRLNDR